MVMNGDYNGDEHMTHISSGMKWERAGHTGDATKHSMRREEYPGAAVGHCARDAGQNTPKLGKPGPAERSDDLSVECEAGC